MLGAQESGRGRQVVGRHARHRLGRPSLGRQFALEPQHGGAEHAAVVQCTGHLWLDRAQVLAHDHGAGAVRLQSEGAEHRRGVMAHVRAPVGRLARRNPPQPPQPGDVVHPDAVDMAQHAAQHVPERLVARGSEPIRTPRWQAPVLAPLVEGVRRRADVRAQCQRVLQRPRLRPRRRDTHGEVADQTDGQVGGVPGLRQLLGTQPLQPHVERRARCQPRGFLRHRG